MSLAQRVQHLSRHPARRPNPLRRHAIQAGRTCNRSWDAVVGVLKSIDVGAEPVDNDGGPVGAGGNLAHEVGSPIHQCQLGVYSSSPYPSV